MALRLIKKHFINEKLDWNLKIAAEVAIFANGGPLHLKTFCSELLK